MFIFDKKKLFSIHKDDILFSRKTNIRFQDIDAAGVIFYARVFDLFHDTYFEFLKSNHINISDILKNKSWAAPIIHAEADYVRPLFFDDQVKSCLLCVHLNSDEITLGHAIQRNNENFIIGQTVHTFINPNSRQRCPIPLEVCQAFTKI